MFLFALFAVKCFSQVNPPRPLRFKIFTYLDPQWNAQSG